MAERIISEETINAFREYLVLEEKSTATVEKYLRDVRAFHLFACHRLWQKSGWWLIKSIWLKRDMQPVQSIPSHKEKRHPFWSDLYYQEREAVGPEQYLGADEIPLRGSRSKSQQGVSPQSAQAVCPDFLRYWERDRQIGRYSGTQQHRHNKNLYYDRRHRTPAKNRTIGPCSLGNKKHHIISIMLFTSPDWMPT